MTHPLEPLWDDVVDEHFPVGSGAPGFLFPAFHEVEGQPEGQHPHLGGMVPSVEFEENLRATIQGDTKILTQAA